MNMQEGSTKQQRHHLIRELLGDPAQPRIGRAPFAVPRPIASQDDLRRKLAERGIHVTQATLSRDIHELRLLKGPGGYTVTVTAADNAESDGPGIRELLSSFALEVRPAGNLLVLITITGGAQPVAAAIDFEGWPEVVGTVAGDDTVLIVCASERRAGTLRTRLEALLG